MVDLHGKCHKEKAMRESPAEWVGQHREMIEKGNDPYKDLGKIPGSRQESDPRGKYGEH